MAATLATSATLSLSHCRWLRISGESVFDRHRPQLRHQHILCLNEKHRPHRLAPWQRLWQPQQRCPCLTAAGSESAGKAFSIVTGPSTPTSTYSLFKRKGIGPIDSYHGSNSSNLSNAVLVSLPLAQNQRGKRFRSSQAPPTPTYSPLKRRSIGPIDSYHGSNSGNLINAVLVSLTLAQNQRGESVFDRHRPLNTDTNILSSQTRKHRPHQLVPWQ